MSTPGRAEPAGAAPRHDERDPARGLSLTPLRGLRPTVDGQQLAGRLSPPYDVIDENLRAELLGRDAHNAVAVILPEPTAQGYAQAADLLRSWIDEGSFAVDDEPTLYVYEMHTSSGETTRGLLGAVELRDPDDGVILPHENTMAGPVADRLEVMTATGTDLEPIYLVYDGGGDASDLVRDAEEHTLLADATGPDGTTHRLWGVTDRAAIDRVAADLATRHALIADGHHRYATYRERQRRAGSAQGAGPWDRGLALLVDTSDYGPQVHAIHRVIPGLGLADALDALADCTVEPLPSAAADELASALDSALGRADGLPHFAAVLTDGDRAVLVSDPDGVLSRAARRDDEPAALADLDVTIVHRGLIESRWGLADTVDTVGYAHSIGETVDAATAAHGLALLLRPTPVAAVAAVAAAGARMPRKSTLFTPKPASGLVMRRLADQQGLG